MTGISYRTVLDAFQPAKEITDPRRFSGRRAELAKGHELLLARNPIFVHGHRGIGKSSLARQLARLASGDKQALIELAIDDNPKDTLDYVTCFTTRDASINNINTLLYRLLIDASGFGEWSSVARLPEVGAYELSGGLNPTLVSEFWNRAQKIATLGRDGLLILVDEFELISDQTGFASLLKSRPPDVNFVVTGIGATERELVKDHSSIERLLDEGKLHVPPMSEEELRHIVRRAEIDVERNVVFGEEATQRLVSLSRGQPYLLHLIGKFSLLVAFRGKETVVTPETIVRALEGIAQSKDSFLEDRYLRAIGNSEQRETTLRVFAALGGANDTVGTAQAYPEARDRGVGNPSYYIGDLQKDQFGSEIEKVGDQYYRLKDPLFRAYVIAIPRHLNTGENEDTAESRPPSLVSVLHISDIHFGAKHFFDALPIAQDSVPDPDKPKLENYLAEAVARCVPGGSVDLLVLSGDATEFGRRSEFDEATKCILDLVPRVLGGEAAGRSERLVVVPGNHDVNWAAGSADPSARGLPFFSYLHFARTCGGTFASDLEPERIYRVHDLTATLGVVVLALNSCVLESAADHRGYIGESQLSNGLQEVDRVDPTRRFSRIAVFHHHLVPVSTLEANAMKADEVMRDAPYVKSRLLEDGFCLVMHGHRHHAFQEKVGNGTGEMVVVGSGSTGVVVAERGEQPLTCMLIGIDRASSTIDVKPLVFDAERRKFVPSADRARVFKLSS